MAKIDEKFMKGNRKLVRAMGNNYGTRRPAAGKKSVKRAAK